jgi:hypothetical protein
VRADVASWGRALDLAHFPHSCGIIGITQDSQPAETGDRLAQEFEPLASKFGLLERHSSDVTARTRQALTKPLPTGSPAIAKTMGMTAVACFKVATASPDVTMTSTFCRANSAAIAAMRSGRPSDQRYSIAIVRPSIQPR